MSFKVDWKVQRLIIPDYVMQTAEGGFGVVPHFSGPQGNKSLDDGSKGLTR